MKSISAVKYLVYGNLIRILEKIQVEEAIMKENTIRFSLAHISPIFDWDIIKAIDSLGQIHTINELIYNNILITTENNQINQFLLLLYQPNYKAISAEISVEYWNNH